MSEEPQGCNHDCANCNLHKTEKECADEKRFADEMAKIKHKIVVLSGKGGVGKSTVAVNLAFGLALDGFSVGLVDVDFHGPSIPTMLGIKGSDVLGMDDRILPVEVAGVKAMSIELFLKDADTALIWRGPMKNAAIKQFLQDVNWGELDYLIVDCPPGTGDEPLGVIQMLQGDVRGLVVTTPQEVAASDVRKSLAFCKTVQLPVAGVVENMSGFVCPHCGEVTYVFNQGGGRKLAEDAGVPFLGALPLDPLVGQVGDEGKPFVMYHKTPVAQAFRGVVEAIENLEPAE